MELGDPQEHTCNNTGYCADASTPCTYWFEGISDDSGLLGMMNYLDGIDASVPN